MAYRFNGDLYRKYSYDNGVSWVNDGAIKQGGVNLSPSLCLASDGILWLSWCGADGGDYDPIIPAVLTAA